jgi:RNA polymerase sigma-70 factor (ECF subfamily)
LCGTELGRKRARFAGARFAAPVERIDPTSVWTPNRAARSFQDTGWRPISLQFVRVEAYAGFERAQARAAGVQALDMADEDGRDQTEVLPKSFSTGDPDAFRSAFERFCRPVFSFILGLVGDRALAEDLTQETFVRAFRGLKSLRQEARLSTWIFGIARNVAREALRQRKSRGVKLDLDELGWERLADSRATQDRSMIDAELHGKVERAMAGLPEDQRLVFVLKIVNRMRYDEIARITGASIPKLKTDMHRARMAMRRRLAPYIEGQAPGTRGEQ